MPHLFHELLGFPDVQPSTQKQAVWVPVCDLGCIKFCPLVSRISQNQVRFVKGFLILVVCSAIRQPKGGQILSHVFNVENGPDGLMVGLGSLVGSRCVIRCFSPTVVVVATGQLGHFPTCNMSRGAMFLVAFAPPEGSEVVQSSIPKTKHSWSFLDVGDTEAFGFRRVSL